MSFIQSLSLQPGLTHSVRRSNIFDDVLSIYQNQRHQVLKEYPFRVRFEGEKGIDAGGVARDMYSEFYEAAYVSLFDGSSLLTPVVHPEMDTTSLSTFGFVLSHGYLMSGILTIRIAFPSLAQSLLGASVILNDSILVKAFIDSISIHEAGIVKVAEAEVGQQISVFSPEVKSGHCSVASTPGKYQPQIVSCG